MLPFVLPDIWGTCYQQLLAALSKCISPAARHRADRQRDVPMAPADTATAQFTCLPCCQGPAGRLLSLHCWHACTYPLKGRKRTLPPPPPFPYQPLLCLFKGEGRKNRPKKAKLKQQQQQQQSQETWDEGEMCWRKENLLYFFVCPATALSSAALAEIALCALAFSLLLYCKRVIRIIYCLAARLFLSVENASLIFSVCLYNIHTCVYVMQGAVRTSLHAITINFYD